MFKDVPPCIVVPLKMCLGKDDMVINSENFSPRSTGINVGSQIPDQIDRGSVHDEEADEGSRQQTDVVVDNSNRCRLSWVELPTCTVCLRRLQCSASGIEGGNDIPVSMWFSGNTARCKACKVYGEGAETVGSGISKPNSQVYGSLFAICHPLRTVQSIKVISILSASFSLHHISSDKCMLCVAQRALLHIFFMSPCSFVTVTHVVCGEIFGHV